MAYCSSFNGFVMHFNQDDVHVVVKHGVSCFKIRSSHCLTCVKVVVMYAAWCVDVITPLFVVGIVVNVVKQHGVRENGSLLTWHLMIDVGFDAVNSKVGVVL